MTKGVAGFWRRLWRSHDQTRNMMKLTPGSETPPRDNYTRSQLLGLFLGPILFLLTLYFFTPEDLSFEGRAVLAATLWIATWWITEAIPIPATSLLPFLLLPLTGALDNDTVASAYGNDIIFLFLGGFFIATAMEKWNLHKRIALAIISIVGTSTQRILLGFMLATAFLSMWVSNTASVMMMVPMALAITAQVAHELRDKPEARFIPSFEKALLFGVGYAGTIGGLGTLIGTPPNVILKAQVETLFGYEITFFSWMLIGVPLVILMLIFAWLYLGRVAFPMDLRTLPGGHELIQAERRALGVIGREEKSVAVIFTVAAVLWITRGLWGSWVPDSSDGMVAVFAAVLLFLVPAGPGDSNRLLDWKDSREIPWGILLLFGGGLAIAAGFVETDLSEWMGSQLTVLEAMPLIIMIACAALLILFLTEITSNTATATMILPVVASLALALNVHPFALMIPCAMAANCAFMLPVGTPPNAIIFATEKLRIIEMMKVGFIVNLVAAALIVLSVYYMVPIIWDIDLRVVPPEFLQ